MNIESALNNVMSYDVAEWGYAEESAKITGRRIILGDDGLLWIAINAQDEHELIAAGYEVAR